MEFAQARFDCGKKICPRLDEHQRFSGGFDRALLSINRLDIVNQIDAGCEFLGDQGARDATSFLWRTRRRKGSDSRDIEDLKANPEFDPIRKIRGFDKLGTLHR